MCWSRSSPSARASGRAHNAGKAASEVSFPVIRERAIALALAVAAKLELVTTPAIPMETPDKVEAA